MKKKIFNLLVFLVLSMGYIQAQDYLISFNGSGASTTVESVIYAWTGYSVRCLKNF